MTQPSITPEIRKSLNVSWQEGIFANVMLVFMDYYLIPFALFLGATPTEIGMLVAFSNFFGSVSQLFAVPIIKKTGSRLNFLITGAKFQAAVLIPIAGIGFFAFEGRIRVLIILASIFRILGNLIGTAWGSLVSDYLPPEQRGKYFGWRSQIAGIAGIVSLCIAGLFLFLIKKISPALGFALLFFAGSLCRFLSARLFKEMKDLPQEQKSENDFTFFMFLRRFKESNFVKFVLYVASITFATQLAAPYFSVHMLQNLKFNYAVYMSVHLCAVLAGLLSFPLWGKYADRVGNAQIIRITSFLIPIIPVLWLFSSNHYYLMSVEFLAGLVWGGFNLCATNFVYDAVTPEKRVRCLGYFNLINGLAIFSGALLGGFLAERLPSIFGYRLLTLFLISGLLRGAAHFFLSGQFQEVRTSVEKVSTIDLFFSVLGIRAQTGRNPEWNILTLFRKPDILNEKNFTAEK